MSVLRIMGAQYIVDDTLLWNVVLATNFETLYSFVLKQPSGLNLSQTAKHLAKLVQGYNIIVLAPIGFIVFSALHEISSLSGRPGQCISPQISPQLIKIRIKSFQTTIRFFKAGFRRNPNIFVQKFGSNTMNAAKYRHKYWQLEVAILRYCRNKG